MAVALRALPRAAEDIRSPGPAQVRRAKGTPVPVTLILLLIVFGALIAAGIPVALAGGAVAATISLLAVPSRWLPIGAGTGEVALIPGMAVGVDYSLFYLRREREERAAGRSLGEPGGCVALAAGGGACPPGGAPIR